MEKLMDEWGRITFFGICVTGKEATCSLRVPCNK